MKLDLKMLQPNDIEIIELLLENSYDGMKVARLKRELLKDDQFSSLYEDMKILVLAIRASAMKTTLQHKVNNLKSI